MSIANPGIQPVVVGQVIAQKINAINAGGGTLTYLAIGLPPGLSINTTTGVISGTIPNSSDATGVFASSIMVTNGTSGSTVAVIWNVADPSLGSSTTNSSEQVVEEEEKEEDGEVSDKAKNDRELDSVEITLVGLFLNAIDNLSRDEFEQVVALARFRVDPDLTSINVKDKDPKGLVAEFKKDPGGVIAGMAFAGGANAITLPSPLSNNGNKIVIVSTKSIRGSKPGAKPDDEPTVADKFNLALEAHELQHVVQMVRAKKGSEFLAKYLTAYVGNRVKYKMSDQDAYELIPAEIEGHAVQTAVGKVLKDATNLKKFKELAEVKPEPAILHWGRLTTGKDAEELAKQFKTEYEKAKKELTDSLEKKKQGK